MIDLGAEQLEAAATSLRALLRLGLGDFAGHSATVFLRSTEGLLAAGVKANEAASAGK